jgi:hypothetical protein
MLFRILPPSSPLFRPRPPSGSSGSSGSGKFHFSTFFTPPPRRPNLPETAIRGRPSPPPFLFCSGGLSTAVPALINTAASARCLASPRKSLSRFSGFSRNGIIPKPSVLMRGRISTARTMSGSGSLRSWKYYPWIQHKKQCRFKLLMIYRVRMTHAELIFAGAAGCILMLGCHRHPDPTANLPAYSLHLANRLTGEAVVGARISPYCGIPGDTNIWLTDHRGLVSFRSWFAKGGTFITVGAEGYLSTNISLPLTNRVTTLLLDKVP